MSFQSIRNDVTRSVDEAESEVDSAISELQELLDDNEDLLTDVESGAVDAEESRPFARVVEKVEKLFSQTADAVNSELDEVGASFYDVESEVEEMFLETIREAGYDALADTVNLSW